MTSTAAGVTTDITSLASFTSSPALPGAFATATPGLYQDYGYGGPVTITATVNGSSFSSQLVTTPAAMIYAWGDSLTASDGASSNATTWTTELEVALQRYDNPQGFPGQTSTQIAARQGAVPTIVTLAGNATAPGSQVLVTSIAPLLLSSVSLGDVSATGTVGGVHGTLMRTAADVYSFQQDVSGSMFAVPPGSAFVPDLGVGSYSAVSIFWTGRNNFTDPTTVLSDTAAMAAKVFASRFLVMSVLNGSTEPSGTVNYTTLTTLNASLAAAYPNNYLDVRAILVAAYNPTLPQDVLDHQNDVVPTSLRVDSVHLNDAGYAIVASAVASYIAAKGGAWF